MALHKVIVCAGTDHASEIEGVEGHSRISFCMIGFLLFSGRAKIQCEADRARDHFFFVGMNNADRYRTGRRGNHALACRKFARSRMVTRERLATYSV